MNKTIEEKKKILREYIQAHPNCTSKQIKKATKFKIERIYSNMIEAYNDANVSLSKNLTRRSKEKQKSDIIDYIRKNPGCSVPEIRAKTGVNVTRLFESIINAYQFAGVKYPQRDFTKGVVNPVVVNRSLNFEKEVINQLKTIGEVRPKVRTKTGIVDCILNYKNKDYVVEVKDFRSRNNITMSQIKQLIRYLKELNLKNGLIICPKDSFPKQKNERNLYIGGLKIMILSDEDLRGRSIKEL